MIKSAVVFKITTDSDSFKDSLSEFSYRPLSGLSEQSTGFIPVVDTEEELFREVDSRLVVRVKQEKKKVPPAYLKKVLKERVVAREADSGHKMKKAEIAELKEIVKDELLVKAFSTFNETYAWISLKSGLLYVAASRSKAEEIVALIAKANPTASMEMVDIHAESLMTALLKEEPVESLGLGDSCELVDPESGNAVKYLKKIDMDQVLVHLAEGKLPKSLEIYLDDDDYNLSATLNSNVEVKGIKSSLKPEIKDFDATFLIGAAAAEQLLAEMIAYSEK